MKYSIDFLRKLKQEVDLFEAGKSVVAYPDSQSHYSGSSHTARVKITGDGRLDQYRLIHELAHFYQAESGIEKSDDELEYEADIVYLKYMYFMERKDVAKIISDNTTCRILKCSYLNILLMDDELYTIDDIIDVGGVQTRIGAKLLAKLPILDVNMSYPILQGINKSGDPIFHLSLRNNKHLWYARAATPNWEDFVIPFFFLWNKSFVLNSGDLSRDMAIIDDKKLLYSSYTNNNRHADFTIEVNDQFQGIIETSVCMG